MRQLELERLQAELRVRNIESERRPSFTVEGLAQYQSEVVELPIALPDGRAPRPPRDSYELGVRLDQSVIDPGRSARIDLERAILREAEATIRVSLHELRREVDEAFFAAAILQEQGDQIELALRDLDARLQEARARVEQGVALRSEAASIEALLLERQRDLATVRADRRAAMERLARLTGTDLPRDAGLVVPDWTAIAQAALARFAAAMERPELARFAGATDRLETRKRLLDSADDPRVGAYAKAAYGRPGLNFLEDDFHGWWIAGVRVQWQPFDWGRAERERRILELEQAAIGADEEAFISRVRRGLETDIATIQRLSDTAETDRRIIELRELIERETRLRLEERVVTAAEYVDRYTDLLEARLAAARNRVELARSSARVLTALGVEVP